MQFGRSYEEFEVGATYKHWPGKTVTEFNDHLFCLLTMNHHPIHLDRNYTPGDPRSSARTSSSATTSTRCCSGCRCRTSSARRSRTSRSSRLRHVAPTFHGDTLYGETTVLDKWETTLKDDRGVVHVETIGYKQDGTSCASSGARSWCRGHLPRGARRRATRPPGPVPDNNWPGPARPPPDLPDRPGPPGPFPDLAGRPSPVQIESGPQPDRGPRSRGVATTPIPRGGAVRPRPARAGARLAACRTGLARRGR